MRGDPHRCAPAVFPDGVCDFGKPGIGEQPSIPWVMHDGNGGVPLGDPPKSVPL